MRAGFPGAMRASVGTRFLPPKLHGLQLWLDAADASTIISSSGSVSQWNDKSGQGNHATQGTGSAKPTTGTVTQNSTNVIDFDGGDTLALPSGLHGIPNGDFTIFLVMKQDGVANERMLSAGIGGSTRLQMEMSSGDVAFHCNATFDKVVASIDETNWNIVTCFKKSTTAQSISVNGGTATTDAAGANISGIDGFAIASNQAGTDNFFNGNIAEILIYNRALLTSEITVVEAYLTPKWDVGLSIPSDISGLQLWLDADEASTITSSSGLVSQWNDKSGNGFNVTQGTGSEQPTTNATTQNGKNVIDFDAGDELDIPSGLFSVPAGSNTIFAVVKANATSANEMRILEMEVSGGTRFDLGFLSDSLVADFLNGSVVAISASVTVAQWNIHRGRRDGTTQAISINGADEATNTSGSDITADLGFIGSTGGDRFLNGSIAEIIIYNRSLSTTEIAAVETYLSKKWGI